MLTSSLPTIETKVMPGTVDALAAFRRWANPELRRMIRESRAALWVEKSGDDDARLYAEGYL